MSLPTLEQYRSGATTWRREHRGVTFTLSHHGVSSYSPQGTWCYYLHLLENMFQRSADFALFDREPELREFAGSICEHYDYYSIPDLDFHGGCTWYSKDRFIDRKSGKWLTALKIGCDYNDLWDDEGGYWEGLEEVERDAKRSVDILADQFPLNVRCAYSGVVANPSEFYTARNGCLVHESKKGDVDGLWLPASADTHPKDGDVKQAPLSGVAGEAETPNG